jgi:hypothetical protein
VEESLFNENLKVFKLSSSYEASFGELYPQRLTLKTKSMKGHWIWMVIGCGLPLLLIFFAPALGITGYNGLFAFIIVMFLVHLFIPHGGHGNSGHAHGGHGESGKTNGHERGKDEPAVGTQEEHKGHRHH